MVDDPLKARSPWVASARQFEGMTGQHSIFCGVWRRPQVRGRRRGLLESTGLVVVCAVVVLGVVITNSSTGPLFPSSSAGMTGTTVRLRDFSRLAAANQHLARIGARVRIVPLTTSCPRANRPRLNGYGELSLTNPHQMSATEAAPGDTTVVVASHHGLTGFEFVVSGHAPNCLPASGTAPYDQW